MTHVNSANDPKRKLTPLQFRVTQQCGTEPPFQNEFWNNKREGIYVDVISGEPLFSSKDKFDSGTGWPSFVRALKEENIATKADSSYGMDRVEVHSKRGNSHLGHVFNDGPAPTGQRYCINSAALRFIPAEELEKEGYGEYAKLFHKTDSPDETERDIQTATFAAGCFWGVQSIFKEVKGVIGTTAGYTGGSYPNPTYRQVCAGLTGHAEAVQILFDAKAVSHKELLALFWRMHDPTTPNRQGPDVGTQYRSAIFYHSEEQRKEAERSKEEFDRSGAYANKSATQIVAASIFYPAEEYHQDYFEKQSFGACHSLRDRCNR